MDKQQMELFFHISSQISTLHGQVNALTDAVATLLADHQKKEFEVVIAQINQKAYEYGMHDLKNVHEILQKTFESPSEQPHP